MGPALSNCDEEGEAYMDAQQLRDLKLASLRDRWDHLYPNDAVDRSSIQEELSTYLSRTAMVAQATLMELKRMIENSSLPTEFKEAFSAKYEIWRENIELMGDALLFRLQE
jgi:hypothetical protein